MRKNILVTIVTVAIFVFTCTGCAAGKEKTPVTLDTATEEIDISVFKEVETSSENIGVYREEVAQRLETLEEGDDFITDEEWSAISSKCDNSNNLYRHQYYITSFDELYESTSKYYYPVVFREGDALVMWYTDEHGSVLLKGVYGFWNSSNYVGHLHTDSEDHFMASEVNYTFTYSQESSEVTVWKFGKSDAVYSVPTESVYCGHSDFIGYIFRSGSDVYTLTEDGTVVCIAHNVKYVIDADYYYGSDPWCQPLFLMKDGTIKAYIGWNGNQASPDDESHLSELQYEGSWDK